jgi:serine acetyltransferase
MVPPKEGTSFSDFHLLLFRGESGILLAGHSHWKNIQYRKARQDAIKNIRNGKLSLEISAAVKGKHFFIKHRAF